MINHFAKVSLKNSTQNTIKQTQTTRNSFVLNYPCTDTHLCTPYIVDLSPGVYQFECWGSIGGQWGGTSKPGLGAYTSGKLFVPKPTPFYVYIGNVGFFNAVKEVETSLNGISPGGATDVRLKDSDNWWDENSLISRIMVAAGGGGAEWTASIGGNGGTLEGGESISAHTDQGTTTYSEHCPGAKQTSGSECHSFYRDINYPNQECSAVAGQFGTAIKPDPIHISSSESSYDDYGAFGGGGYYGGTSYQYSFAGSGGSSFISGYEGCKAVKDQKDIEHTNTSYHYSGFIFTNTKMISGNQSMPLPTSLEEGFYNGTGAFRLTLLLYQFHCTYKRSLYYSLIPNLFLIISFSVNNS